MKKTKIIYWIVTGLFAAFMVMSAIQNIMMTPDSVALISTQLQFPTYLIPFLGWAKILGVIGILVPGYPRVTEWAYAGLFFDLAGATFGGFAVATTFDPLSLTMSIFFIFLFISYYYYHKKLKETNQPAVK